MASTFGGLNTALTSLYAQRRGLDVTGQNIANANTEGYTRQKIQMQAQVGSPNPGVYSTVSAVGAGVSVSALERGRNEFLEERGRTEHGNSAYLASQRTAYSAVEDVFAEPSDTALQARLHDMWDAWNDVSNNWQDASTRTALLERAKAVTTTMNDAYGSLSNQYTASGKGMQTYVEQVNTLAGQVADLNQQIVVAKSGGVSANELADQRDRQIMQLAELAGVTTSEQPNGAINVYIGNGPLVSEFTTRKVQLDGPGTLDEMMHPIAGHLTKMQLTWTDTHSAASAGGTMGSMVDTMNTIIPDTVRSIDDVASRLASDVNTVHRSGYGISGATNQDFFTGTDAKTITVNLAGPDDVAFSSQDPRTVGKNNDIADQLLDVSTSPQGADQAYRAMIGQLGVSAQASGRRSEIQDSVTQQVDTTRQAESGVNLDEEMTHMLTYQRGYEAASRVLTTVDSMLDQLINRTGLVGR